MTDTQESVDIDQITNYQRFGFLRRLLNSFIAREWFTCGIIAAVVVVGALYHHHSINSLEARFETTVEKMLDKREKGSRAFIAEAIKTIESNMARKLEEAIKTSETNMVGKFDMIRRLSGLGPSSSSSVQILQMAWELFGRQGKQDTTAQQQCRVPEPSPCGKY